MPAPAVIPAPIAYIKVVAVKKLVVGLQSSERPVHQQKVCTGAYALPSGNLSCFFTEAGAQHQIIYLEKIRVFKAGRRA